MIKYYIFTIILAIIYALLEIQVEGRDGWCRNLPTFRINVFFRKILGGKPLTGYHLFMLIFMIMVFHGLFLHEVYTLNTSAKALGLLFWFFVLEDALWFIFNPHYTCRKFNKKCIEWHRRWFCKLPISYWVGMFLGTFLLILGGR